MKFYKQFKNKNLKIAHRGYRSIRPENTLSAFEQSLGKFDFIELDIQVTKDYKLVVFHDYTLQRTTNIDKNKEFPFNGSYKIYDYTLDELKLLDIGSWFLSSDPFGTIKKDKKLKDELKHLPKQTILTLEDILLFGTINSVGLNIELKDCSYIDDTLFVSKLYDAIKKSNIQVPLLISSFNHNYLKLIKKFDTNISTASNVENFHKKDLIKYLKDLDVEAYHISSNLVSTAPISELIKNDIFISVFTVNDKKLQNSYFKKGIKAIFTDK